MVMGWGLIPIDLTEIYGPAGGEGRYEPAYDKAIGISGGIYALTFRISFACLIWGAC